MSGKKGIIYNIRRVDHQQKYYEPLCTGNNQFYNIMHLNIYEYEYEVQYFQIENYTFNIGFYDNKKSISNHKSMRHTQTVIPFHVMGSLLVIALHESEKYRIIF